MRDLKFRVWSAQKKHYLNGAQDETGYKYGIEAKCGRSLSIIKIDSCGDVESVLHDCVIEQYTGLKDKNGREIYEGDILLSDVHEKPCNYIVIWNDDRVNYAGFALNPVMKNPPKITLFVHGFKFWMATGFIVIGNIHENPELINATL